MYGVGSSETSFNSEVGVTCSAVYSNLGKGLLAAAYLVDGMKLLAFLYICRRSQSEVTPYGVPTERLPALEELP